MVMDLRSAGYDLVSITEQIAGAEPRSPLHCRPYPLRQ
jgi:hypothetical protein